MPGPMKEFVDELIWHLRVRGWRGCGRMPIGPDWFETRPASDDRILLAYLGGMAEHLANLAGIDRPAWSDETVLDKPTIYASGRRSAELIIEQTPKEFAWRNVFCGAVLEKMWRIIRSES